MTTSANELYGHAKREISLILPILNEEAHLTGAVKAILAQDFQGLFEIVLAVGPSKDSTLKIAEALAVADPRVVIVLNPTGRTAAGLNLAIKTARYSIVVRVDGRSEIPKDYLTLAYSILSETGAVNVGGVMAAVGTNLFERSVARAMRSALGVGASRFHTGGVAGAVDTVYLGAFRREALVAIGGFDERFTRAQDWELNFRLRSLGGLIYFDPRLVVTYRPRASVKALAKQYFEYGRWRRVVSRRHEGTINYRYLAPPITVLATALSLLLGTLVSLLFFLPALAYAIFIFIASIGIGETIGEIICLPLVLLTMHLSWGIGFLTSHKVLAPLTR